MNYRICTGSDSSSSDDEIVYSPPDTDRRQSKDRSRSKQQSKRHKKNSHKDKPCYERQHSSTNSSGKPTEKSRHDDQDYESRTVTNPYLEKAQEYLEQYGYGDEKEKCCLIRRFQVLKARISLSKEVMFFQISNVRDDEGDNVEPTRPNVCNSFLNKGACLQLECKYLHFRPDAAYPSYGYRKGHSNKPYRHSLANVSGAGPHSQKCGPNIWLYKQHNWLTER